jgi:glycosyltransferase involved in cell wall biosynthesis
MRIQILHNAYQIAGGEDSVVTEEAQGLHVAGHDVDTVIVDNDRITGALQKIRTALETPYSFMARKMVRERAQAFRPDVIHIHNFFPLLSPSIYDELQSFPLVQTLHNYRAMCVSANFYRDGAVCEDCLGKTVPVSGVIHGCYRGSHVGSAMVATMLGLANSRKSWGHVDRFIALTEFSRTMFVAHHQIPPDRIVVKPNGVADPGIGDGSGKFLLYVGRLSEEKGIRTLLRAATDGLGMPVRVIGTGPLVGIVRDAASRGVVRFEGALPSGAVLEAMRSASALLCPSEWYEGLPMVVLEAFGVGLPVIASDIGSLASTIMPGVNGLLHKPGDAGGLRDLTLQFAADEAIQESLRLGARSSYNSLYTIEANVARLETIYSDSISHASTRHEHQVWP